MAGTTIISARSFQAPSAKGASESERTPDRLGCRAGHYGRTLITRVGKLELRVPQDRQGRFSTELFERHQATLAETYVQGCPPARVKASCVRRPFAPPRTC